MTDKIDTQGMSLPSEGSSHTKREYPPLIIPKRTIFTEEERKELKQIINEALDEREDRKLFYNDPNPKRPIDVEAKKGLESFAKELLE